MESPIQAMNPHYNLTNTNLSELQFRQYWPMSCSFRIGILTSDWAAYCSCYSHPPICSGYSDLNEGQ